MKTCTSCGVEKDDSEFYKRKNREKSSAKCKDCEKQNVTERTVRIAKFVNRLKRIYGCCVCGYNKCPDAMDLHHIDPGDKNGAIARMIHSHSFAKIKAEIRKCVVLCAICHREYHAGLIDLPCKKGEKNE